MTRNNVFCSHRRGGFIVKFYPGNSSSSFLLAAKTHSCLDDPNHLPARASSCLTLFLWGSESPTQIGAPSPPNYRSSREVRIPIRGPELGVFGVRFCMGVGLQGIRCFFYRRRQEAQTRRLPHPKLNVKCQISGNLRNNRWNLRDSASTSLRFLSRGLFDPSVGRKLARK